MGLIAALTDFTPGTIAQSGQVDANFAAIRDAFNASAVLTDVAKTISVAHLFDQASPMRFTHANMANGDIFYLASGNGSLTRLAIGAAGRVLTSSGTAPQWSTTITGVIAMEQGTSDGSDNSVFYITGGGSGGGPTRGGTVEVSGNEHANTGQVRVYAGNVTGGHILFYTDNAVERLRIHRSGGISLGTTTTPGSGGMLVEYQVPFQSKDFGGNVRTILALDADAAADSVRVGHSSHDLYVQCDSLTFQQASTPSVTGSKGGNAALSSLLTALNALGLITDDSS